MTSDYSRQARSLKERKTQKQKSIDFESTCGRVIIGVCVCAHVPVCVTAYVLGVTGADSPELSWSQPVWPRRNAETTKDHCSCCCRDDFTSSQTQLVQPERDKHVTAQKRQKCKLGQPSERLSRRNVILQLGVKKHKNKGEGRCEYIWRHLHLLHLNFFFSLN